jgi:hypothetical protein
MARPPHLSHTSSGDYGAGQAGHSTDKAPEVTGYSCDLQGHRKSLSGYRESTFPGPLPTASQLLHRTQTLRQGPGFCLGHGRSFAVPNHSLSCGTEPPRVPLGMVIIITMRQVDIQEPGDRRGQGRLFMRSSHRAGGKPPHEEG